MKPTLIDVTERLVIRELSDDDVAEYQKIVDSCASGVMPDLTGLSAAEFAARHHEYIRYQYGFYGYGIWGVFLKGNAQTYETYSLGKEGPLVGLVGLVNGSASKSGEISYALLPDYRNRGYASEAISAALEYGTECGFTAYEARINLNNDISIHLAKKHNINIIII